MRNVHLNLEILLGGEKSQGIFEIEWWKPYCRTVPPQCGFNGLKLSLCGIHGSHFAAVLHSSNQWKLKPLLWILGCVILWRLNRKSNLMKVCQTLLMFLPVLNTWIGVCAYGESHCGSTVNWVVAGKEMERSVSSGASAGSGNSKNSSNGLHKFPSLKLLPKSYFYSWLYFELCRSFGFQKVHALNQRENCL